MPKEKYESPNPRRTHTLMSQEDIQAGKKSSWYELEITGRTRHYNSDDFRNQSLFVLYQTILCLTLHHTNQLSTTLGKKHFENIVGKGENAVNQHFFLFPQCFLPLPNQILILWSHLFCYLQMLSTLTDVKFCCWLI